MLISCKWIILDEGRKYIFKDYNAQHFHGQTAVYHGLEGACVIGYKNKHFC